MEAPLATQLKPQAIWAVGRNYAEHARELGNEVPSEPLIFLKAGACATPDQVAIQAPALCQDLHHEIEIAVELDARLQPRQLALALDLTERTLQTELKKKGHPWTLAKSFRGACPVSQALPFSWELWPELQIELEVNSQLRQRGETKQMIFPLPSLLEHLRSLYPLQEGDLILTGTPQGVGPLRPGDELLARLKKGPDQILLSARWRVESPLKKP